MLEINGAITRQDYNKNAVKTSFAVRSSGDKSGKYNSSEEIYQNGTHIFETGEISKISTKCNRMSSYGGNNIIDTIGNESNYTGGLNEGAFGSRTRIIGNPDVVNSKLHETADRLKSKLVATRSGFNDNRNEGNISKLSTLGNIPKNIFNNITSVEDDVANGDDIPLPNHGNNLFIAMAADIAIELGLYSDKLSKISASSSKEMAKLSILNEKEKLKKQEELIKNLPESYSKEKIIQEASSGNLTALLSNPSNEDKNKKSTYNKDAYEALASEILPDIIELEKQCC